jgi:hypothetical protein
VVQELGDVFKNDETRTLMKKNAVKTANETLANISAVFTEIDGLLKKSKKNAFGRLMLPFRDAKIELLRSHIDKLKSTLQLLLQVLIHAHQVAANKLDREAEAAHKAQIQELIDLKKKSTEKYEESLKNFSFSSDETLPVGEDEPEMDQTDSVRSLAMATATIGSTINPKTLETCVQHVRTLLNSIESLHHALTNAAEGDDHSEHHQTLIGSYFCARGHLDSVLFSGSQQQSASEEQRPQAVYDESESMRKDSQQNGYQVRLPKNYLMSTALQLSHQQHKEQDLDRPQRPVQLPYASASMRERTQQSFNQAPPRNQQGLLSTRLQLSHQQHKQQGSIPYNNIPQPIPAQDPRMPPTGLSQSSSGAQTPASNASMRFNVRACEFKPNPLATLFHPRATQATKDGLRPEAHVALPAGLGPRTRGDMENLGMSLPTTESRFAVNDESVATLDAGQIQGDSNSYTDQTIPSTASPSRGYHGRENGSHAPSPDTLLVHSRDDLSVPQPSLPPQADVAMAIPRAREEAPPPLPPPRHLHELSVGQDPSWQWGHTNSPRDTGFVGNRLATVRPGSSLYGARSKKKEDKISLGDFLGHQCMRTPLRLAHVEY